MNNPRMTNKERNLVKGAIRRVFSRSELRQQIIDLTIDKDHVDLTRKRVKTWCLCQACKKHQARSYMNVDHIVPVVPIGKTLIDLSWDDVVDSIWCERNNLQAICIDCHDQKSSEERKLRRKKKHE